MSDLFNDIDIQIRDAISSFLDGRLSVVDDAITNGDFSTNNGKALFWAGQTGTESFEAVSTAWSNGDIFKSLSAASGGTALVEAFDIVDYSGLDTAVADAVSAYNDSLLVPLTPDELDALTARVNEYAEDQKRQRWRDASLKFAQGASGKVTVLLDTNLEEFRDGTIFWDTELQALIDNPNIESINGIPRAQLASVDKATAFEIVHHASTDSIYILQQAYAKQGGTEPFSLANFGSEGGNERLAAVQELFDKTGTARYAAQNFSAGHEHLDGLGLEHADADKLAHMHTRLLGSADGAVNIADALILGAAAWLLYKSSDYDLETAWEEVKSKVTAETAAEFVVGAFAFGAGAAAMTTLLGPLGAAAVVTFGAYATYDDFRVLLDGYRQQYPDWEFLTWIDESLDTVEAELGSHLPDFEIKFPDVYIADKETKVVGDENTNLQIGREDSILEGGDGDDYQLHFGSGEMDGGAGDDLLVAIVPDYVADGEGGFKRLEIDGGAGNDTILSLGGNGPVVHGGAGDDWILVWSFGAEVYGDEGADTFMWAPDILIADAEAQDRLSFFGITLTGGIAYGGEESQWAHQSFLPFIRYGLNSAGELVVDVFGNQMYVADYVGGPGASENTLDIYLARIEFAVYQILDDRPALKASPLSDLIGAQLKAMGIIDANDPLALDLDGDGLEFTGLKTSDTYFDLDGDEFAERTAWLRSDDGFLAMDRDGDGAVGDISELFGAPGVSGFSELSDLDSNSDGVIDALDTAFGDLLVWRDLNQDGLSSADELFTLADLDIASVDLNATVTDTETPSGNILHAESTFTFGDGSQGNIYDVLLDSSQFDTQYKGDGGVADWAAEVPDLKGYGLLTDLKVAVSNDLSLAQTLSQVSGNLNTVDLDALKAAVEPLLLGWNSANENSQELAPVLVQTDANGAQWLDYGVYAEDAQGGYWTLASDNPVLDSAGDPIARPTLEDLLAQTPGTDQAWRLEQMWSPADGGAFSDRPEAPYKVALNADGKATVLDYGVYVEDAQGGYWTLASGTAVLDDLGDPIARPTLEDVFAQAAGDDEQWRVETFAATEAAAVVDSFAVFYTNGIAVDYAVYVDDPSGCYWASAQAVAEAISLSETTPAGPTHADLQSFVDLYLAANVGSITGSDLLDTEKAGYAIKTGGAELSDLNNLVVTVDALGELVYVQNVEQQAEFLQEVVARYDFWGEAVAVRLAAQTGLSSFFQDVVYNPETDVFEAATVRELIPLYEAIFAAAPGDAQGALDYLQDWREILNVVYADFKQHGNGAMSESFVFANVVAAYESTGLAAGILEAAEILGVPTDSIIHDTTADAVVDGTDGRDIFYASTGDQTMRGGQDSDVYVFGKNFGHDVIDDVEAPLSNRGADLVRFADIGSTEVEAHREGLDLILTVTATGDTLRIVKQFEGREPGLFGGDFSDDTGVTEIAFADGVVWDIVDMAWAVADPQDTSDILLGTPEIDVLDGGAGDDTLSGGAESDLYIFNQGYGHDQIEDNNDKVLIEHTDVVKFGEGIEKEDLVLTRDGNSSTLEIAVGDNGDALTVIDQFEAIYTGPLGKDWLDRVELFTFEDGSYYSWQDIMVKMVADAKTEGDDTIWGFSYEDTLDGGAGDDTLIGGNENDTYLVGLGYGHDTIDEGLDNILSGTIDTLRFLQGIDPSAVSFSRDGDSDDLEIDLTDGTSVTVKGQFDVTVTGVFGNIWFDQIEFFTFADDPSTSITYADVMETLRQKYSTDGDDQLYGFSVDETLEAGLGDDFINGGDGNDTYVYNLGDGNDTIRDEAHDVLLDRDGDRILFGAGISLADLTFSHPTGTDDLVIGIAPTDETITVSKQFFTDNLGNVFENINLFEFADGTVLTDAEVRALALEQAKTSGDDTIEGFFGADTLDGGLGNDRLIGGDGGDTYVFDRGYGEDAVYDKQTSIFFDQPDKVAFGPGISPSDLIVRRAGTNGNDLVFDISGTADKLTIEGNFLTSYLTVEEFHFDDGTIWTQETIRDLLLQGTDGDDVLIGFDADDVLDGGLGNDRLEGEDGSDTYIFDRGYGQDVVYDKQSSALIQQTDIISFGPGILPSDLTVSREGSFNEDLVFRIQGTEDSLTVEDMFYTEYTRVEEFQFSDGTVWSVQDVKDLLLASTDGDDHILGFDDSDDTLAGGLGNDTLEGMDGADTYVFNLGDGQDVVIDFQGDALSSARDKILFGPGILSTDVVFSMSGSSNQNLVITISGTTDSLTINNHFNADYYRVEDFQFDDGTVLTYEDVNTLLFGGTPGDDTLTGTNGDDVLYGYDGNDVINGLNGDDELYGGNGNDTISAGYGDDYIEGGDGDDTISAGAYDDTVLAGAGNDVVETAGGNDFLDGGEGVDTFVQGFSYSDLRLDLSTGRGLLYSYNPYVFNFENAAGSYGADTIKGTSGANDIWGNSGNDVLDGRAGDDRLYGGAGNDELIGGDGNDWMSGDAGTDSFDGGAGIDTADFSFSTADWTLDLSAGQAVTGTTVETITGIENLVAGSGDDTLIGNTDDNELTGGAGDDSLDGGYGRDTAVFSGIAAGYSVSTVGDTFTVTDTDLTDGDDGTDALTSIEALRFADEEVTLVPEPDFTVEDGLASAPVDTTVEGDVVINAPDGYSGVLGYSIVTAATNGTVSVDANGHYVYAASQGFAGSDSFEILVTDDSGAERVVTIAVEMRGDEPMSEAAVANDISRYNMTTDSDYWMMQPAVTALEGGDYLVIWPQFDGDGSSEGILARRYDQAGNPVSGEILVNGARSYAQTLPDVVGMPDGGFLAVWTSQLTDGSDEGVYFRRFDSDNNAIGDDVLVNTTTANEQRRPSVALTNDGGFVIVWESWYQDGSGYGIFARNFDSDGVAQAPEIQINSFTTGSQSDAHVSMLSGDRFVVTWISADQDGSGYGVYGRVCASDGTFVSSEFQVHEFPANAQWEPDVAALADGGFVIAWQDDSEAFSAGSGSDIVARQFDADGVATGASFRVNSGDVAGDQLSPSITALADGGFYVVWGSQADNSIYGQRFAADGTQVGSHEVLAQTALAEDWKPDVTVLEDGGIAVSWQESLSSGGRTNVFTRVIYGGHRQEVIGTDGADVLIGDDGDNVLTGGAGSDRLTGGQGDDSYLFGYGDDQDVIENGDSDAATSTDRILLGDGVDTSEAWFRRDGNDLVLQLLGSDDTVTVAGWYSDDPECIDVIETSEGDTLSAGSVESLVAAMASFSVSAVESGEVETHPDYANVQTAIAANWENHV